MGYNIEIDQSQPNKKFLQIANQLTSDLTNGKIMPNQILPSINQMSKAANVSRDTVEKAYNRLKELGLVISVPGKGVFAFNNIIHRKILCVVDELSESIKEFYEGFAKKLGEHFRVDIAVHRGKPDELKSIFSRSLSIYDFFAVVPVFHSRFGPASYKSCFDLINQNQLLIIDRKGFITGDHRCIYRDFKIGISEALDINAHLLKHYPSITLISSLTNYYQTEVFEGVSVFCKEQQKKLNILRNLDQVTLARGELYIVSDDLHMATLLKKAFNSGFKVGVDIAIISTNDSCFIELLDISALTSNSYQMGIKAADILVSSQPIEIDCKMHFVKRNSF